MKGIYLGAYQAYHPEFDIVYQDINGKRDIGGDMMQIDLADYDYVIATPPCNYYSRARGNRKPSQYALNTAHLLPDIIDKLHHSKKPFIVENVRNDSAFRKLGLFDYKDIYVYRIGRHTIWSSIPFYHWIPFDYEFININGHCVDLNDRKNRQGSDNVHRIVDKWLQTIHNLN